MTDLSLPCYLNNKGLIFLIAVSCLLTRSNVAEAVHLGTEVALGVGEALVTCPLTIDVSKTKHGIAIRHERDEVLLCSWLQDDKLVCDSPFGFELVGNLTNHVTAKVLVARLQSNGLYKCQLVPSLHEDDPSTACYVIKCNTGGLDGPSAGEVPEVLPREQQTPAPDPPEKDVQNSDCKDGEYQRGLTAVVTALTFIVVFLLLLVAVVFFYLWFKRYKKEVGSFLRKVLKREQVFSDEPLTTENHTPDVERASFLLSEEASGEPRTRTTLDL